MNLARTPEARPGRACPLDYRYAPSVLDRAPDLAAPALYVAGGLYGNLGALAALEAMAAAEAGARIVLNGDVHWFDAEPAWFKAVEAAASRHLALRGNVETEVARGDGRAGCGCAYPAEVDDATVERSNAILADLVRVAPPAARRRLAGLPMHLVAAVGPARVAIVHGDAESLAGWRFDRAALDDPGERDWRAAVAGASGIDVFASTHTCAPALRLTDAGFVVANNGAAGMPNAAGRRAGIVTRIGVAPSPWPALYGIAHRGVRIDALDLPYDHAAFLSAFDRRWPAGSAAAASYRRRIVEGPPFGLDPARPA